MKTHGSINPETLSAFLEGLPDLLESLRAEGYGLGTRQHVAAHELVGSLFAHGGLPPTLLELDEWLAPIICYTPAQQEDFRERYLQWLVARRLVDEADLPPAPPPVTLPEPPPVTPPPPVPERIARWVSAHRRPLVVSGAALVATALSIAYLFYAAYRQDEDLTRVVVLNPPVPQPAPVPLPPAEILVSDDDNVVTPVAVETTGQAWDVENTGGVRGSVDLSQVKLDDAPPPPGFWARNYMTLVVLAMVTPFVGLGLWHFLRRRRRRRDAERLNKERPRYDKIKVRGARERVFQSAALRPIARGLRHYLSVDSRQLDARSTVLASVGRGGLFTPVYGRRRTLPEYLVLIDRVGFGDQLAQFNSDIVARLAENDVYLDTYYFHGDPRRCREGGPDSPQLSLSDLAARHPDHYLLIFSDGTGLLSTTTGRPEPFVEQLLFWRGRALLTPVPRLEWEYREWALEREGLKVLPASLDGLRLLVETVNTGARSARTPDFDETPPYPDSLRRQPGLWKERDEPPPHQTRRLVTHLRRYLGPRGFELLCACAVYPVMQWGVTLFLAYELLERREADGLLPRLLRLPWFRNGTMPPWLRRTLVRELPRARRRLVRERLEHLLLAFLEAPERGLRPRSEEERAARPSLLARLGERLEALRRRRQLRRRLEPAPPRSPLAEPVFLNFITANRRAEALPEPVRQRLFPRGIAAFGLRLAPAAALVAVAALTALFLLLLQRPVEDFYTPGAPPDLMSRLLASTPEHTNDPDYAYTPTNAQRGQTVEVTVRAVTPGEYDLSKMRLAPADPNSKITLKPVSAGKGVSYSAVSANSDSLSASIVVAPDAPPGPTELLLYEGDKLRARLPFNVGASASPAPTPTPEVREMMVIAPVTVPCPTVTVQRSERPVAPGRPAVTVLTANVSDMRAEWGTLTYTWRVSGGFSILNGQGTPVVEMTRGASSAQGGPQSSEVEIEIGGRELPRVCHGSFRYVLSQPTPTISVSVGPGTITVCPSNPKLNEPPDSNVTVTVGRGSLGSTVTFDARVNEGKISQTGDDRSGRPTFAWNLSGVAPGTYTVTVSPYVRDPNAPTGTAKVTVNGCRAAVISDLKLGKDQAAIRQTSSFAPSDTVYAVATISNVPGAVKVTGRLAIEDVEGEQSGPIPGLEKTLDLPGSGTATYTFTPPTSGFPKGRYKVEIFIFDEAGAQKDRKSVSFTVN